MHSVSFASTSLVIVGAGFSAAATDGRTPLMATFFDQLDPEQFADLHDFIAAVTPDPKSANVEQVLLALEQFRTSPDSVLAGWAERWKRDQHRIHAQVSQYTLQRLRTSVDVEDDNWAAGVLSTCGRATTVVSMNYDNIAERCLSCREGLTHLAWGISKPSCPHCKMRQLLDRACSCAGHGDLRPSDWIGAVLKPHGSVAWRRCQNPECCSYECLVANEHCLPYEPCKCPHCASDCGLAMVTPSMTKRLDEVKEIGVMWQATRAALSSAESIALFGFSMPTSDELFMQMMRRAIHENTRLASVTAIDLDPESVMSRFRRCLPPQARVRFIPLRVEPRCRPTWAQATLLTKST